MSNSQTPGQRFWDAIVMGAGLGLGAFLLQLALELLKSGL